MITNDSIATSRSAKRRLTSRAETTNEQRALDLGAATKPISGDDLASAFSDCRG